MKGASKRWFFRTKKRLSLSLSGDDLLSLSLVLELDNNSYDAEKCIILHLE